MSLIDKIKDIFDGDEKAKQEQAPTGPEHTVENPVEATTEVVTETVENIEVPVVPVIEEPVAAAPAPAAPAPVAPAPVVEEAPAVEATTYTVVEGDTLWGIAESFLGDGSRYQEIADLNGIDNPDLINVGQVITIP